MDQPSETSGIRALFAKWLSSNRQSPEGQRLKAQTPKGPPSKEPSDENEAEAFFLPDFCRPQSILMVLLTGELLALIITLLLAESGQSLWYWLGIYSISIQAIALFSVATLCQLRRYLARFSELTAGILSWLVILLVTLMYSFVIIRYYYALPIQLGQPAQSSILLKNLLIAGLLGAVALRYFYLQQRYKRQLELEASARLQALQARIRPHFLFNSLNVIASLTRLDPAKAEHAIEDLSDLIRATLDHKGELIPLQKELENGQRYLSLEQIRLGDRLRLDWQVEPDCEQHPVPPLSIQPILENAVYHGIQTLTEGGVVSLSARLEGEVLRVSVTNPRVAEEEKRYHRHKGRGMALRNIRQRLEVLYGSAAQLNTQVSDTSYQVTMTIPKPMQEK